MKFITKDEIRLVNDIDMLMVEITGDPLVHITFTSWSSHILIFIQTGILF